MLDTLWNLVKPADDVTNSNALTSKIPDQYGHIEIKTGVASR